MPERSAIDHWKGVENAVSILTMRLSTNGATRRMGDGLMPEATTAQLLAYVITTAIEVRMELEHADA